MEALQFESAAPKRLATVSPPVDEALVKVRSLVVRELVVRRDADVVASVEVPVTPSAEESSALVPVIEPRLDTVA